MPKPEHETGDFDNRPSPNPAASYVDDVIELLAKSDDPAAIGRIDHYDVMKDLGSGGFGVVFRAFDTKLRRVVAVKVLWPSIARARTARERFPREAQAAAALQHENVVRIYETGDEPLPYLVMEFIEGETLQQRLERCGSLDAAECLRVARQVAAGLGAAHEKGIIHRDINPSNIMIDRQQLVKITDFGLARVGGDIGLTPSNTVVGTPKYMAPEQAKSETIDHRADLFSLGSVLFEMLTGCPPFDAPTPLAVLKLISDQQPRRILDLNPTVPSGLARVVERLHAKNPDHRFATARDVIAALEQCETSPSEEDERPGILITSVSPRRHALLRQIGLRPDRDFVMVDLSLPVGIQTGTLEQVKEQVVQTAREKVAHGFRTAVPKSGVDAHKAVLVGADTVVWCDGRVLDRPIKTRPDSTNAGDIEKGRQRARESLAFQRGRTILVITGLVVARADDPTREESCCVVTEAKMRNYSDADIEGYLRSDEPLFLAGAFGIQERGVALFEKIKGSYTNVVGLPLTEFVELLRRPTFRGRVRPLAWSPQVAPKHPASLSNFVPLLSAMALGDLNYDLTAELPAGFFDNLKSPGPKRRVEIGRRAGGTAVIFSRQARAAGFTRSSVLGMVGGCELGRWIYDQLMREGISCVFPPELSREGTSLALVLRDAAPRDTSITLTDARQSLTLKQIEKVKDEIESANLLFVSGYALTDMNRWEATKRAMEIARSSRRLVVLDAVVGMSQEPGFTTYDQFKSSLGFGSPGRKPVDVLVIEIPDALRWWNRDESSQLDFDFLRHEVLPELGKDFPVVLLRTSDYSHEIALFPTEAVSGAKPPHSDLVLCRDGTAKRIVFRQLDYQALPPERKLGYADGLTARHLLRCLAPRLVLASSSPRRIELLQQLAAENKIEVRPARVDESRLQDESPEDRVRRLASAKARWVYDERQFSTHVEVVIGADTEVVIQDGDRRVEVGNPATIDEARTILRRLSGRTHEAMTGLSLIHTRLTGVDGQPLCATEVVTTRVTFRTLSDDEIDRYVQTREPLGKAGAYGIQGKGALFVESIEGSYSNVVGLPLERLSQLLAGFSVSVWDLSQPANWQSLEDSS